MRAESGTPDEESSGLRDSSESSEKQALEGATVDPRAHVEQTGDIRQAEEIQETFSRVVEEATTKREAGDVGANPIPIPNVAEQGVSDEPTQPKEFEKPILMEELEDLDSGLGEIGEFEDLLPGKGKIEGGPGSGLGGEDLGGSMLEDILGDDFGGGPSNLKGSQTGGDEQGADIPGWDSPFLPGKGPGGGGVADDGGTQRDTKLQDYLEDEAKSKSIRESREDNYNVVSPIKHSGNVNPDGDPILEAARQAHAAKPADQVDDDEDPPAPKPNTSSEGTDDVGGRDMKTPIGMQVDEGSMDPKYDQDLISNYPEDHETTQHAGETVRPQYAEKVKQMVEKSLRLSKTTPKTKGEEITDPPVDDPSPKKRSETTGKTE